MFCEACCSPRPQEFFTEEDRQMWRRPDTKCTGITCLPCQGSTMNTGQDSVEMIWCTGCSSRQPLYNYLERQLLEWRAKGTADQEAVCARCHVRTMETSRKVLYKCKDCGKEKHIKDFTCVSIRHWLLRTRHNHILVCFDCHYPTCAMPKCGKRPETYASS